MGLKEVDNQVSFIAIMTVRRDTIMLHLQVESAVQSDGASTCYKQGKFGHLSNDSFLPSVKARFDKNFMRKIIITFYLFQIILTFTALSILKEQQLDFPG